MSGTTIDPLGVSKEITDSYRRYLKTSFSFQDPQRQSELEHALLADQALANGPILQATAPYATGRSLAELIDEGVVSSELRRMKPEDFPIERPLYKHQEEAIRKLVGNRNLMVATGTGSGKTECFLLPAIHRLLAEKEAGTLGDPGIRVLLLYPMNALANDQLKRLRELLRAFPEITFGRYVGDTKPGTKKATDHHRAVFGEEPLPNELVAREQMQANPPHILITNFAMLEYLLLRPADTAFFDGPTGKHWKMVVLDEVHVYDGAKGAELGMLLRRVRGRVHKGTQGQLQVVGTSATLGQGSEAVPELAKFGNKLFDEPFAPSDADPFGCDVVEPTRQELVGVERWTLPQHLIGELATCWRDGGKVTHLAEIVAAGQPPEQPGATDTVGSYLHRVPPFGTARRCAPT
ncbi:MAG: DEAD/DEAH box helicase [Acidimicrobiales bacterium]